MLSAARSLAKKALKPFDIAFIRDSRLQRLETQSEACDALQLLLQYPDQTAAALLKHLRVSKSQLHQDAFVLAELGMKRNGYFVEFGATNGIDFSNTYLFEKEFAWQGIVAEPARCWHAALRANRSCQIETDCVWRESHKVLTFNEADSGELSTIASHSCLDAHQHARKKGRKYGVRTISLVDMLDKYRAPRTIDYLSIDTEGSEYRILSAFDFARYKFRVITCEHNFSPQRESIFALLSREGYRRKFEKFSQFDDWYVRND